MLRQKNRRRYSRNSPRVEESEAPTLKSVPRIPGIFFRPFECTRSLDSWPIHRPEVTRITPVGRLSDGIPRRPLRRPMAITTRDTQGGKPLRRKWTRNESAQGDLQAFG